LVSASAPTASTAVPAATGERAHFKFWPKRVPRSITPPVGSLWHNLAVSAMRYPGKPALVFFDQHLTYAQLLHKAELLAQYLKGLGVQKGDRVVVCMQNCPQLVISHFAVLRLDAVVVPVNPMNKAEELKHYITDPDTQVAITTADLSGEWANATNALPAQERLKHLVITHFADAFGDKAADDMPQAWREWLLTQHAEPLLASGACHVWNTVMMAMARAMQSGALPLPPACATSDDLAILPYTSGTTGLPKGVMHTHGSVMHNAVAVGLWSGSSAQSVSLCAVPMFHITGLVSVMQATIFGGATLVIMPRWDRELAGRVISRHKVTHWGNIPTMVIDLLASPSFEQYDLSSLVSIGGGGAAMPQAVAQRLWEQFGLRYVEGYGLTETAAPSHQNPPDATKQQCLGIPYIGCDARVIDPITLLEVPQGEQGEIIMCGPMNLQGYWKNPEATAQAFIEMDGKKFFRSGDLGKVDEEGYFFITDRLKRMINASGFKVWPAEVEALMFKHPAIAEACIISSKDAYRGETVKAVVVLRKSHLDTKAEDILQWCRDNMAVYKAPKLVQFVEALPKSGSGKVMWRALQEAEAG
jgi:fatty-acyl-CoA synthase